MSKHTPGPWNFEAMKRGDGFNIVVDGGTIAQTWGGNKQRSNEQGPNARLIAAAPELLKFVEQWAGHHLNCDYLDEGNPRTDCTCGYDKSRDEILAKATQ